jgi:hypothetical protein
MKQFQGSNHSNRQQPIQSELPPIRTFEIWNNDDRPYGYEITHKPYPASANGYEYTHLVFGKRARFCFVSHDGSISRTDCIAFGSALVNGTFTVFHCDLTPIQGKRK